MATPGPVVAIAAGSYAEGHQDVFHRVEDGTVFHRWQHGGDDWWAWTWMPAPVPVRALSCAGVRAGTIDLYAVDDGGVQSPPVQPVRPLPTPGGRLRMAA